MRFCSIDPGAEGAYAIFDGMNLVGVHDFSWREKDGTKIIDTEAFVQHLTVSHVSAIVIEKVGARQGQGVSSMFSFGERFGEVKTLSSFVVDDIFFVTPQKWKNAVGLIGTDKKQSAIASAKVYPSHAIKFVEPNKRCKAGKKFYDGRGDAVMLGLASIKLGIIYDNS